MGQAKDLAVAPKCIVLTLETIEVLFPGTIYERPSKSKTG
jgi:hypothetical protein